MGAHLDAHLRWCALRNLRASTIEQRRYALARLRRALDVPIEDATADELAAWYATLVNIAPESRGTELAHVRQYFKWLQAEGYRNDEPTVRLPRPRLRRRLPRPILDEDLEVALATAPERVKPWLYLATFTGLRACEIANLRREDVLDRQDPPVLLVADGKGGKQRVVPLHPEVAQILDEAVLPASGYLFRRLKGPPGPVAPHLVSLYSNTHLHSLGITSTLHTLRHWFGTKIYQQSLDLRLTQEMMGHQSPVTTAGYAAYSPLAGSAVIRSLSVGLRADNDACGTGAVAASGSVTQRDDPGPTMSVSA